MSFEIYFILVYYPFFRLSVDDLDPNLDGILTLGRDLFETLSAPLLRRVEEALIETLTKSDLTSQDIHKVLLVGGSCRIPMIQHLLRKMFTRAEHLSDENPDEVVAMGAAHYANFYNSEAESSKKDKCLVM